jgi:MFS transporter, DHA1 family, multidrug resistance protein
MKARPLMGPSLMLVLGGLSALGSLGIHSFVPALPAAAAELNVAPGLMQLAISVYLVALAIGQLLGGWLSDFRGRRQVLVSGAALYVCGSLAAAAAPGFGPLLAARVAQGLGGACGLVVARSIVVDLAAAEETTGRLAILATIGFVSPALAPLAGGLLVEFGSWRLIFLTLGGLGLVGLVGALRIPETRRAAPGRDHLSPHAFLILLGNAIFRRYALINTSATIGMFVFLTASPFLLRDLYALHGAQAGLAYLLVACGVVLGALTVGPLERTRAGRGLAIGTSFYLAGAGAMLACSLVASQVAGLVGPMMIVGIGSGMIGPSCLSGALRADARYVGTASSLFGALQIAGGASASVLAAALYGSSILVVALPLCAAAIVVFAAARFSRSR